MKKLRWVSLAEHMAGTIHEFQNMKGRNQFEHLDIDVGDNTEIYLIETGCGFVDCFHVVQEKFQQWTLLNMF